MSVQIQIPLNLISSSNSLSLRHAENSAQSNTRCLIKGISSIQNQESQVLQFLRTYNYPRSNYGTGNFVAQHSCRQEIIVRILGRSLDALKLLLPELVVLDVHCFRERRLSLKYLPNQTINYSHAFQSCQLINQYLRTYN